MLNVGRKVGVGARKYSLKGREAAGMDEERGETCASAPLGGVRLRAAREDRGGAMRVVEGIAAEVVESAKGSDELRKKVEDWRRRIKVWKEAGVATTGTLEERARRAAETFSQEADRPGVSAGNQCERIRKAISASFGVNLCVHTRVGMPLPFDEFVARIECVPGAPLLRAWSQSMNEYPGNHRAVEALETPDRGFGRMVADVALAIETRSEFVRGIVDQPMAIAIDRAAEVLVAQTPRSRTLAMAEFRAREAVRFEGALRTIGEIIVLGDVLQALGGEREAVLASHEIVAEGALAVAEAHYLSSCVAGAVEKASAAALARRCAEHVQGFSRGFPGFKDIVGNRATSSSRYLLLDLQPEDASGQVFRLILDKRAANQERIDRVLSVLRKVDEAPRSGYAAMNYKRKEFGAEDDQVVANYLHRTAMWVHGEDQDARLLGVVPAGVAGQNLAVVCPSEEVGRRGYLLPLLAATLANYFSAPDRVGISGYRPSGRFVTFYKGGTAVAHAWAKAEIAEGVPFDDAAIRIVLGAEGGVIG